MDLIPVYCISGLGADERVFEHLSLPGCKLIPLPWIAPEPKEPLNHYAGRMASHIIHPMPVLMGLSFGGMLAVEMSRLVPLRRTWLLSTVKVRQELPPYMRFGSILPLHKVILRLNPHKWMGRWENANLTIETPEEALMVAEYRKTIDPVFLRWAIDVIVRWDNRTLPANTLHIHGGKDRIFPLRYVRPDHTIPGAGHFMVHNRAAVVSTLLQNDLLR